MARWGMAGSPRTLAFEGHGGVRLVAGVLGDDGAPAVILLHGGGQTRHAWDRTAERLVERGFRTLALDLRGHGDSDWDPDADYSLDAFAADLERLLRSLGEPAALVGASLGGITSLLVAAESDLAVSAVVLVDITPRLERAGVARILGFMTSRPDGFASLDEAADAIAAYLPDRPRPDDPSGLSKNLRRGRDGRWRWHWDPRFITGSRPPSTDDAAARLRAAAGALSMPALLVRGKRSDVVSDEGVAEFRASAPHAEFVDVARAGHMVAGDDNDVFSAAIVDFLARALR